MKIIIIYYYSFNAVRQNEYTFILININNMNNFHLDIRIEFIYEIILFVIIMNNYYFNADVKRMNQSNAMHNSYTQPH